MVSTVVTDFVKESTVCPLWPPIDPSELIFQVQFTGHEFVGPRYYVHRENFDSVLLTYTSKGHTNVLVDGKPYLAYAGTFIFYDCRSTFTSTTDLPDDGCNFSAELYYVHLYPNRFLSKFLSELTQNGPIIRVGEDDCGLIEIVNGLIKASKTNTIDQNYFSCQIYRTLCQIKNRMENGQLVNAIPATVKNVQAYVSENFSKKLTVSACAKYVHLSPNYLESLFCTHVGVPLAAYIANCRFQKSADLLVNTDLSVSQIAEEVGLPDSRSLIRLYRKKTNTTPLAYRKQHQHK